MSAGAMTYWTLGQQTDPEVLQNGLGQLGLPGYAPQSRAWLMSLKAALAEQFAKPEELIRPLRHKHRNGYKSWMFAAANPPDKAAAGVDLTPPMVNRLCVIPWETPVAAIREGWRNGLEFPAPDVPILPDNWRDYLPKWGIVMDEFIQRFPDLLEAYPRDPAKAAEPYPTPRSWTNVIRLLAAAESVQANKCVRRLLVNGCVGDGAGVQFLAFLDTVALPDPEDILADPRSLRLPRRGDLAVAIVRSVLARVESDSSPQRWERCCDVFEHTFRQSREVAMAGYGRLWKLKPSGYLPVQRNGVFAEMDALRSA